MNFFRARRARARRARGWKQLYGREVAITSRILRRAGSLGSAHPKIPIVAFRKKILDGGVFWVQDPFTACGNPVSRRRYVDICTAPVIGYFLLYLCFRRVP